MVKFEVCYEIIPKKIKPAHSNWICLLNVEDKNIYSYKKKLDLPIYWTWIFSHMGWSLCVGKEQQSVDVKLTKCKWDSA